MPPSQGKTVPVVHRDSSDSRNSAARATPAELADDLLGYLRAAA
jgi:hypothetical protein